MRASAAQITTTRAVTAFTLLHLSESAAAPDLHIAAEVTGGTFAIGGGTPLEVSWQLTGIRQEAWANANRIPVEADKPAHDQGRYLQPYLFEDGHGEPIEALTVGQREPAAPARSRIPGAVSG